STKGDTMSLGTILIIILILVLLGVIPQPSLGIWPVWNCRPHSHHSHYFGAVRQALTGRAEIIQKEKGSLGLAGMTCQTQRRKAMLKIGLAAFLTIAALSPAYAAQDLCNDAHMKQMDDMIAKMTDAAKKKEATTALDMSKAAMKKGDKAGCMKHMDEAHKAMGL